MSVAETSRLSYQALIDNNELGPRCKAVVAAIFIDGPLTRDEIAEKTGMRLSSVCGRVNELVCVGVLEETAPKRSPVTGKLQKVVRIAPRQKELALA
jgi:predicted transcriptional regulator